jgi:hypothetical protein
MALYHNKNHLYNFFSLVTKLSLGVCALYVMSSVSTNITNMSNIDDGFMYRKYTYYLCIVLFDVSR